MAICELCKDTFPDGKEELISYYDLCDLGTALGLLSSLPLDEMDISPVIPGCTSIPDAESNPGTNLADWKVCGNCHRSIREELGRSEFPPRHYEVDTVQEIPPTEKKKPLWKFW